MNLFWRFIRSCKTEFKVVLGVLTVLFILPLFAVVVIANAGVTEVAHALASLNPITHMVEIKDPNGNIIQQLQATTTWPVVGQITTNFGDPDLPYQLHHTGIDIANPHQHIGDSVTTFMVGKVVTAYTGTGSGYGNYIVVDHGNHITSLYGHLSQVLVKKGDDVKPGDVIGIEGSTGNSTGPHVHFEIRLYDVPVDPRTFMIGIPPIGPAV